MLSTQKADAWPTCVWWLLQQDNWVEKKTPPADALQLTPRKPTLLPPPAFTSLSWGPVKHAIASAQSS